MNPILTGLRVVTALALLMILVAGPVGAWEGDLDVNNLVSDRLQDSIRTSILSDNLGGYYVVWDDSRPTGLHDLYAQRLDADGNALWAENGVQVFRVADEIAIFKTAVDGDGTLFIGITTGTYDTYRVSVQMVGTDGKLPWVSLAGRQATPFTPGYQEYFDMVVDGHGGVIVGFSDTRNEVFSGTDIWAQRLDSTGALLWGTTGVPVCQQPGEQFSLQIVTVELEKTMFFWSDGRNDATSGFDIYGEALDSSGMGQWGVVAPGGVPFCDFTGRQYLSDAVSDGFQGAVLVWGDARNSTDPNDYDIYTQRIHPSGVTYWKGYGGDGIPVCTNPERQFTPRLAPDGVGGACIVWHDLRFSPQTNHMYGQYVSSAGYPMWATDGIQIMEGVAVGYAADPTIVQDGLDGWLLLKMFTPNKIVQRVDRDGSFTWDSGGLPLTTGGLMYGYPSMVADGRGGMIGVWPDYRLGVRTSIYAQRLDRWGAPGDASPGLYEVIDRPGDQGGEAIVSWTASNLDISTDPQIDHYSVWMQYAGSTKLAVDLSKSAMDELADRVGINFSDALTLVKSGWALAGQQDAQYFEAYAFHAPTYGDSTDVATPLTTYKVLAHSTEGIAYWESGEMSGWSVDNLSPGAPLALSAARDQGGVDLDWVPSGHNDEDLAEYLVFRSDSPDFIPGPATFIGAAADIEYRDPLAPASVLYYRVIGRDLHGNEGPPSNVATVSGVSGVGDSPPGAFIVHGAVPNPFNPQVTISYEIPRSANVTLRIYDSRGRLVRNLIAGWQEGPQRHEVVWNGTDDSGQRAVSGVYLYRFEAEGYRQTRKMVLLK